MKPSQRGLGIGFDHLETTGGRDRYVKRMVTHQDRMSQVGAVVSLEPPKAAFGGGKYRTPQSASAGGKSASQQEEAFREVREALRVVSAPLRNTCCSLRTAASFVSKLTFMKPTTSRAVCCL